MILGAWLSASGGCTCIIDADKYRGGGGGGDAGDIDAADNVPDAGTPDGRIESDAGPIEPTSAREGEGSGTGAPPVMIVLRGDFEAATTARVVLSDDDTDLVAEPAVVSSDGSMLAVGIRIPVYPEVDEGETATLEIYIDEGRGEDLIDTFTVEGLAEADLSGAVDTTTLRPLYSTITISAAVALAGASPAILRSTSDITVSANLVGDGKLGGAAGPAGCNGGAAAQPGGCDIYGGGAGASGTFGTGGGGGGHAQIGNPGAGGAGGGQMSGNEALPSLAGDGGNGGGGGGNGAIDLGVGGPGGGGGGVIELTASGALLVDALVDASGGDGSDSTGAGICGVNAGGSGGGGSGGAILMRARTIAGDGSLDAARGIGGTHCNAGGNGSPGRVRVDVSTEDLPELAADPTPFRGPHWADDTPHLVREAELAARMYGEPNTTFAANVDGSDPVAVMTNGVGRGTYDVTLEPGHNRICAIVSPTANLSLPEAVRCTVVTYVPE